MPFEASDPIKILIAIFIPPLAVFFEVGLGTHFWINLILSFCGYFPGILHALYIIFKK